MRRTILLSLAAMVLIPVVAGAQGNDRYIVTYRGSATPATRAASVGRAGADLRFNYGIINAVAVTVHNPNQLAALQQDSDVLSVVPDRPVFASQSQANGQANGKPGGGGGGGGGGGSTEVIPEGVKRVGVPTATSNGAGVGVAVVDTGIDLVNSDLTVNTAGGEFHGYGSSCQDDNGHGTHVSGIIAAKQNNDGVVGVAPNATLYCVKVLDASGSGSDSVVIAGLEWVLNHRNSVTPNIRVVNMSLGRTAGSAADDAPMHTAVANLVFAGVTVVVAAGNDSNLNVAQQVPSGFLETISVASTTATDGTNACRRFNGVIAKDTASYFTSHGSSVTISAPGEEREDINTGCFISGTGILSLKPGGGTVRMSGTSMASPHVAGIAARLVQANASATPDQIKQSIKNSAFGVGSKPIDSPTTGYWLDGVYEGVALAPQN